MDGIGLQGVSQPVHPLKGRGLYDDDLDLRGDDIQGIGGGASTKTKRPANIKPLRLIGRIDGPQVEKPMGDLVGKGIRSNGKLLSHPSSPEVKKGACLRGRERVCSVDLYDWQPSCNAQTRQMRVFFRMLEASTLECHCSDHPTQKDLKSLQLARDSDVDSACRREEDAKFQGLRKSVQAGGGRLVGEGAGAGEREGAEELSASSRAGRPL